MSGVPRMIQTNVFVSQDSGSTRSAFHPQRSVKRQWFIEPKLTTSPSGIANKSVSANRSSVVPKPLHRLIVTDQNIDILNPRIQ